MGEKYINNNTKNKKKSTFSFVNFTIISLPFFFKRKNKQTNKQTRCRIEKKTRTFKILNSILVSIHMQYMRLLRFFDIFFLTYTYNIFFVFLDTQSFGGKKEKIN